MMSIFMSSAHAQAAAATPGQSPLMSFMPFILVFLVFYFLMIKPQKKRMQKEQAMLSELSKGDEIFMKSGLIGKIFGITERVITLEVSDGVKIKVLRSQIGGLAKKIFENNDKAPKAVKKLDK